MNYRQIKLKLKIELVLMWPFVFLGKIAGKIFPLKTHHKIFLFYPNGDIGGSPQVNIDIANCIKDYKPLIIFSKKPNNNQFIEKYVIEGVRLIDIHRYIDHKAFHFINFFFRGLLSAWINKQKKATVFGGESIFFYKILPHLKKDVHTVELCHLPTWLKYSVAFIDRINYRVFSTEKLKQSVEQQYQQLHIEKKYFDKLFFVDNAIDIPVCKEYDGNKILQIYFIGRGAAQKRIHLIAAIAKAINIKGLPVKFNFVGDVEKMIAIENYPFCKFYGNINDTSKIKSIYAEADILLLTSSHEGLPIVVMEMMAHGKIVISTAVNGIPDYIQHMKNGLLIKSLEEANIIEEAVFYIEKLVNDKPLRLLLGKNSRQIALTKFSKQNFCKNYFNLLKINY